MPTSPHFKSDELECGCGCGLNNVKPELLDKLERARTLLGVPIVIFSASRCPAHNAAAGGARNSEHLTGEAVDVHCYSDDVRFHMLRIAFELGFARVGIGRAFLHLGISQTHPQGVVWTYPE
jgi:hypothetical protein